MEGIDFLNYGVLGILSTLLVRFAWYSYKELQKDRDTWRAAYEKEREARLEEKQAMAAITEMGRTTVDLLQAIRDGQRAPSA